MRIICNPLDSQQPYHQELKLLYKNLLSEVFLSLNESDSSPSFRLFLKCTTYLLKFIGASFSLSTKHEDLAEFKELLLKFFAKLNDFMNESPDPQNTLRVSAVYANKQLIISRFTIYLNSLKDVFSSTEIAKIIVDFISSISTNSAGKRQVVMDKTKCRLFLALSSNPFWIDPDAQKILVDFTINHMKKLVNLPHCHELVIQDFFSLFHHNRNDFILQFLDELSSFYEKYVQSSDQHEILTLSEQSFQRLCRLLLLIAFTFPSKFPHSLLLRIVKSPVLSISDRFLVFSNFLNQAQSDIQPQDTLQFITTFFNLVLEIFQNEFAKKSSDLIFLPAVQFTIVKDIFKKLTNEQKSSSLLILPLLNCYRFNPSNDLQGILLTILQADMKLNKSTENTMKVIIHDIFSLQDQTNFEQLALLFDGHKSCKDAYNLVKALLALNAAKNNPLDDSRIQAYLDLFEIFSTYNLRDLKLFVKAKLTELYFSLKKDIEAAKCLAELCEYINCDYTLPDKKLLLQIPKVKYINDSKMYFFEGSEFKNGRELHWVLLNKSANILKSQKKYSDALTYIDLIKERVVFNFKHYEIMVDILKLEASIYRLLASEQPPTGK